MTYDEFITWLRATWPHPPDHVLARLRHTLDVYDHNEPGPKDKDMILVATGGIYVDHRGEPVLTGLTWGDLRLIRDCLVKLWEQEDPMKPILDIPLDNFGPNPRPTIR